MKTNEKSGTRNRYQKFVRCRSLVNRAAITRETRDGSEYIIIQSKTLPDNVVMNNGLYPANEIEKSFKQLERTLAPVGHPVNANGRFISADDPLAIERFHVGAHNENVSRENGIVFVDKVISVTMANQTDKGKRLLDRIEEIETNEKARPIHTSVGLFLEVEELAEPKVNAQGVEYTWVAREMIFDHDAILLDEAGAATPEDGVGMAVNLKGVQIKSEAFNVSGQMTVAQIEQPSFDQITKDLHNAVNTKPFGVSAIQEVFFDQFTFISNDKCFKAPYEIKNGSAIIVGFPQPLTRESSYVRQTNHKEGEAMKELILNALKARGIEVNGLTDEQLFAKFSAMQANAEGEGKEGEADSKDGEGSADEGEEGEADEEEGEGAAPETNAQIKVLVKSISTLATQVSALTSKVNAQANQELDELAELISNSSKYPGIDAAAAKKLGVETLKAMVTNCKAAYALPRSSARNDSWQPPAKVEMPD